MPNGTYGGVRGKETKVGQKTFVSRPTRLFLSDKSLKGHITQGGRIIYKDLIYSSLVVWLTGSADDNCLQMVRGYAVWRGVLLPIHIRSGSAEEDE